MHKNKVLETITSLRIARYHIKGDEPHLVEAREQVQLAIHNLVKERDG